LKVKLLRTPERVGLIKARLLGAELARGDVLMFQDAHTECNAGWLEPILAEIQRNPKAVLQPHIDRIDPWSIDYRNDMEWYPIGAFGWDLR
jgi:polypeptide N-acetylgalactosaminyltransferase